MSSTYIGEIISLGVAVSWTTTALFSEQASRRNGVGNVNVIRMVMAMIMLCLTLKLFTGSFLPLHADWQTWGWLMLSGLVGYVFGDTCLFTTYVLIGSRFGELFMTLAPPTAAICGVLFLNEQFTLMNLVGMMVTLSGISMSILGRDGHKFSIKLPLKGVLWGIGAGLGQGGGLVLSKIGMEYYAKNIPSGAADIQAMIPFSATFIRAVAGFMGFMLLVLLKRRLKSLWKACLDVKGLGIITGTTFFGSFLGVALSLMAVQYTSTGIAATIMALCPVLILIPSKFIFKQRVTPVEGIGAIISIIGVSLFFI